MPPTCGQPLPRLSRLHGRHDVRLGGPDPREPLDRVRTTSARVGSSATSTNAKMSGWPQHAWACLTASSDQRAATTSWFFPASTDTRTYAETIRDPLLVRVARNRCTRWHVDNPAGARSGRRSPSACTIRHYRTPEDPWPPLPGERPGRGRRLAPRLPAAGTPAAEQCRAMLQAEPASGGILPHPPRRDKLRKLVRSSMVVRVTSSLMSPPGASRAGSWRAACRP